jgi:hypothetical protein
MEGLAMENRGIFYDHLVYFTAIGNILCPFGIFYCHLVYFPKIWDLESIKIWQPCCKGGYEALFNFVTLT